MTLCMVASKPTVFQHTQEVESMLVKRWSTVYGCLLDIRGLRDIPEAGGPR